MRAFRPDVLESQRLADRVLPALTVTNFPIPLVGLVEPKGITTGPDGALWFTESVADRIGRMTSSGVQTEFDLPAVAFTSDYPDQPPPGPVAIAAGPDGALWFVGVPGEVGRITTSGAVTEFPVPDIPPPSGSAAGTAGTPPTLNAIVAGPDGALWFTGVPGKVGRITKFAVPDDTSKDALPLAKLLGITDGPDGALWFTDPTGRIGRITTTGAVTEFNAPGNFETLAGLTAGPDGNVWFTESENAWPGQQPAVGEITPDGTITIHPLPQGTTFDPRLGVIVDPTDPITGPDGALWFGEAGAVGRITTDGRIEQFPLPVAAATSGGLARGRDGAIWFLEQGPGAAGDPAQQSIGRITPDGHITAYPLSAGHSPQGLMAGRHGNIWFLDDFNRPHTLASRESIGRITPKGRIQEYRLPLREVGPNSMLEDYTTGPDGAIWFTAFSVDNDAKGTEHFAIGRITVGGHVHVRTFPLLSSLNLLSTPSPQQYDMVTTALAAGPDGKLWFAADSDKTQGIARISTGGKLGKFIPTNIAGDMTLGPHGRVWFPYYDPKSTNITLATATRSGTVRIRHLHDPSFRADYDNGGFNRPEVGPDGNIWVSDGLSSIVRISGLDATGARPKSRHGGKS